MKHKNLQEVGADKDMKSKISLFLVIESLVIVWLLVIGSLVIPARVRADTFRSDSYQLQFGNFNMTSGNKSSANFKLTDTVGQNAPGQFDSAGFIVKSGFQYIYDTLNRFSFSIDNGDLAIDFGSLTPLSGTTDTNTITISTPSGHGYQVFSHEIHPLRNFAGQTIPDTNCDAADSCTESDSGTWSDLANTFGFGFNAIGINASGVATGVGTSNIFPNQNYFRRFADAATNESPQIIMTESSPVQNHSARISYKANITNLQPAGDYDTAIVFTAVPYY